MAAKPKESDNSFANRVDRAVARKLSGETVDESDIANSIDYTKRYADASTALRKNSSTLLKKALKGLPVAKGVPALGTIASAIEALEMTNPENRQEAIDQVYKDAEIASAPERFAKGFFSPAETVVGIGAMLTDLGESRAAAKKSALNAPSDDELMRRYLEAKERKKLPILKRTDKVPANKEEDLRYVGEQLA
jgi:hypothetical protein